MELKGTIKKIFDLQTFQSGFQKKEILITTLDEYPQTILVQFLQDKVTLLDPFKVGDEVKISINIRGKEWISPDGVTKYFNSITGWRIEKLTDKKASNHAASENYNIHDQNDDDLPF